MTNRRSKSEIDAIIRRFNMRYKWDGDKGLIWDRKIDAPAKLKPPYPKVYLAGTHYPIWEVLGYLFIVGTKGWSAFDPNQRAHPLNKDRLDFRKENLGFATRSAAGQGVARRKDKADGIKYIGVYASTDKSSFRYSIIKGGIRYSAYNFETQEDAARAHDKMAIFLYGPNAKTNQGLGKFSVS